MTIVAERTPAEPLLEEQHDLPLCDVRIVLMTGAAQDPPEHQGLARHAALLMRRGAGNRPRAELDRAIDALGGWLEVEVSADSISLAGRCLREHLHALVAIAAEIVARPILHEDEHEQLRRESLAILDGVRDDDDLLCAQVFDTHSLAGHPYGDSLVGTKASLHRIEHAHVVAWIARHVVRPAILVGFAGDVDREDARQLCGMILDELSAGPAPEQPALRQPSFAEGRRTILIDKPERTQSQILLGHPAPRYADPAWLALHVAVTILGGCYTSRLVTEVRVKRGWSYGVDAKIARARAGHTLRVHVYPGAEHTAKTLALVLELYEAFVTGGVSADEVELAKRFLEGRFAFEIDTAEKRLGHRIETRLFELPCELHAGMVEKLRAITTEQVNAAIRVWFKPDALVTAVICSAQELHPQLARLPLGSIRVVPYDAV